jgi:hypothetical protein
MTVFVVVCCSGHDLCVVPYADIDSDNLWRFDTSTRGWEVVNNTVVNGAGPSGRSFHVMTTVGRDLWIHGGYVMGSDEGEGETCSSPPTLILVLY